MEGGKRTSPGQRHVKVGCPQPGGGAAQALFPCKGHFLCAAGSFRQAGIKASPWQESTINQGEFGLSAHQMGR